MIVKIINGLDVHNFRDIWALIVIVLLMNPMIQILPKLLIIIPMLIWLLLAYCAEPNIMRKAIMTPSVLFCFIYVVVLLINNIMGRSGFNTHEALLIYLLIYTTYYIVLKNNKILRVFLKMGSIYYAMIMLYSVYRFKTFPGLARRLASGSDEIFREYANSFTVSYAVAYVIVGIIPLIFAFGKLKNKTAGRLHKDCMILCMVGIISLYGLIQCQYTIAVFLTLVFIIIDWFVVSNSKKNIMGIVVLVLFSLIVFCFAQNILTFMINHATGTTLKKRMTEMLMIFQNGGSLNHGDFNNRMKYMKYSWSAFKSSPLVGIGFKEEYFMKVIGGHSTFVDTFGKYGLAGGLPYLLIHISAYRLYSQNVSLIYKRIIWLVFLQYMLLIILNTSESVGIYFGWFFFIPCLIIYESEKNNDEFILLFKP